MEKGCRVKVRKRRKRLFVDRFGGKCEICGYNKCQNSLDFHHVDPTKKEYSPSELMNFSIERAEKELEKCVLVCKNCHGEIHSEEYNFEIDVSRITREWKNIVCDFCGKEFNTRDINRKFCSDKCSSLSQRKVENRPSKEELQILISNNTWVDIGRMFCVSDNTIKKWSRKYNLI